METISKVVHAAGSAVAHMVTGDDAKSRDLEKDVVNDQQKTVYTTTEFGARVDTVDDSLSAGPRGPVLMEDFHFRERMTHFDHERIPERVVHARGSAAHGYFQVYESLEDLTCADFLCNPSKKTPVFVRFSTVVGSRGSADTVRDVRGFATKFYTDQGNFDLVGNNIPVFFVQDAIKFVDVIHAAKPEPDHEMPQAQTAHDNFWDFISLTPETIHMAMWVLSDRAIPRSYRMMQGFGVNTFVLVNKEGRRRFVKFHWLPVLGTHSLVWDEALKLNGVDPDYHRRDLWDAIKTGAYPEYELGVQIVNEEDENNFDFDLLDATKLIPEELVPVRRVGKMVLNRNVDNFFAETEQVAFHLGNLVPGVEPSNDPLLQGRLFSYVDTQLTRLGGPNFQEIPINRSLCPVYNQNRDGMHRMKINRGKVNYHPNRFGCPAMATAAEGAYVYSAPMIEGARCRARGPKFGEHYNQARMFYQSLSAWEKTHLRDAAIFELGKVDDLPVRQRMVDHLNKVDHELATQVALGIGVEPPARSQAVAPSMLSPAVSQDRTIRDSIKSRRIAFLVAPGYSGGQLAAIAGAMEAAGAVPFIVGPNKGPVPSGSGPSATAQFSFRTCKSVMFDAVCVVGGAHAAALAGKGDVLAFLHEAFKHCKTIAAVDEGVDLLQTLTLPGVNLAAAGTTDAVNDMGVVTMRGFTENALTMVGAISFGKMLFDAIASHRHYQRSTDAVPA